MLMALFYRLPPSGKPRPSRRAGSMKLAVKKILSSDGKRMNLVQN